LERWNPALDKFSEVTGLSVELFDAGARLILNPRRLTPLVALLRQYDSEPGLFAECALRCVRQGGTRPAVVVAESHGLTVVGTSLMLEGKIVGAAVAGYALAGFSQVASVQRWAREADVPFDRLWSIVRQQAPVPARRLKLHGELLQVLGDALLRENHRTRQYEALVVQLQAADAAKDEFLAVVSHELRSPLTPIAGWASVLKTSEDLEQVHRAAEIIERNALLQGRMVEDLIDMTRLARDTMELDLEILDASTVVRRALEDSAQDIGKKAIRVEVLEAGEPLRVEGDAVRLEQVFRNIVSNAVKFTPAAGSIRVTLGRDADNARIVIADTGKGIAPEFLPFVFEMFRQQQHGTRRGKEGLGIGLSLVKKLVDRHHGTVAVSSAGPGRGTVVEVRLPLAAGAQQPAGAAPAAAEATLPFTGLSILAVEDFEDARESLRALLVRLGATVTAAQDGREGLEMMQQGAKPDVVLCDLLMPGMDGFEFMRGLERLPAHPPVIALSSLLGGRERSREAGFQGYVGKPYSDAAVIAAVRAATKRS
jgi:signal transduction histidine kinase/CheY-like chemotaxis protein